MTSTPERERVTWAQWAAMSPEQKASLRERERLARERVKEQWRERFLQTPLLRSQLEKRGESWLEALVKGAAGLWAITP